jgi:hypothetical protein
MNEGFFFHHSFHFFSFSLLGIVIGGILFLAVAIPIAIVVGPFYGCYKLHKRRQRNRQSPH